MIVFIRTLKTTATPSWSNHEAVYVLRSRWYCKKASTGPPSPPQTLLIAGNMTEILYPHVITTVADASVQGAGFNALG